MLFTLHYELLHGPGVDYSRVKPKDVDLEEFSARIRDKHVTFVMKRECETEQAARDVVDGYIQAWQYQAVIQIGTDALTLRFEYAEETDSPRIRPCFFRFTTPMATGTVFPAQYPDLPSWPLSGDAKSMADRYIGYCEGKEPLPSMTYFCLTVLESQVRSTTHRRTKAARRFDIAETVLDRVGELSSTMGGKDARKASENRALSEQEKQFLEQAVRTMIHRVAQVAHNPTARFPQITMEALSACGAIRIS